MTVALVATTERRIAVLMKSASYVVAGLFALSLVQPVFANDMSKDTTSNKSDQMTAQNSGDRVKQAQEALQAKGEDPGSVDGIMGPKTRAALKKFQQQNNLKVTGTLDKDTADKLGLSQSNDSNNSHDTNK